MNNNPVRIIPLMFFWTLFLCRPSMVRSQFAVDLFSFMWQAAGTCDEGGYEYKSTLFNHSPGQIHGIKLGWAVGDRFTLGTGYYFHYNRISSGDRHAMLELTGGYATLYGEYHWRKREESPFGFSGILHTGTGVMAIEGTQLPPGFMQNSTCWIVEPGVQFNIRLLNIFRMSAGASYRIVSGTRLYGLTDGRLSGPCLNASLQLTGREY